jgi:putative salt-induced outer membrane protein YdiY
MKSKNVRTLLRSSVATAAAVVMLGLTTQADVVETTGGSVIQGRVLSTDGGVVKVETDFAGVIEIKQAEVKSIVTDKPVFVQLADGNTVQGRIEKAGEALRVTGTTGAMQTQTGSIAHIWQPGDKSPAERAADALRRRWVYEAALDLNGKKGNSDRLFFGVSGKATLQGEADRLFFYGAYAKAEDNDLTSQDELKLGGDYSNFFTDKMSWYVRTELGYDKTKALDLRSQSAAGVGYTVIKNANQSLELRGGLSYRFENYSVGNDFDSIGLDLGLLHSYVFTWGKMTNSITLTPSFDDFANYVLIHESALELPVASGQSWKLRLGLKNDYTSEPPLGLKKHDWSYFTQLVYSWK